MKSIAGGLATTMVVIATIMIVIFLIVIAIWVGLSLEPTSDKASRAGLGFWCVWLLVGSASMATAGAALGTLAGIAEDISYLAAAKRDESITSKP
jgi:amino acid transporter